MYETYIPSGLASEITVDHGMCHDLAQHCESDSSSELDYDSYYGVDESDDVHDLVSLPDNCPDEVDDVIGINPLANGTDPFDDEDSIIAAANSLLLAKRKRRLAGSSNNNEIDDDVRSLNSFLVFPDPRKLNSDEATSTKQDITKSKNTSLNKEKQMLWNSLKDYGLFHREKLEKEITSRMVCRACLEEYFEISNEAKGVNDINNFGMKTCSTTSAFVSLLTVECASGKHTFLIEPPRRNNKSEKQDLQTGETLPKKKGRLPSTHRI